MSKDIQTTAMEKNEILEFETHLAAASSKQTINERNSLLLSQVIIKTLTLGFFGLH